MTTGLLTDCAGTKLLTDCYESRLLVDDGVMSVTYTWAAPYEVETGTTFLTKTIGYWCQAELGESAGSIPPYMDWDGYTDYIDKVCIKVGEAFQDGAWTESTTITLAAAWYVTASSPSSVTVTVTYGGVTQSVVVYPGIKPGGFSCTLYSSYPVGTITVLEDGTFTLV